jgi:hypothetical protein
MNCISQPSLDEGQLVSYIDGGADDSVVTHIAQCPYCQNRVGQLARLQNRLRARLFRAHCPSAMQLGDYHLGLLPASQALMVAQHVRGCPHCRREVQQLGMYLKDLQSPIGVVEAIQVLVAKLVNGSSETGLHSMTPALRGHRKGPLQFAAEGVLIVLDILPASEGKMNILGQLAADNQDNWTGAQVELRQGDMIQFSTQVDDLGAFRAENIPSGLKELRITPESKSIVVVSNFEL